ncbi:cytochrome P450 [Mycobacterium riyadhense]
MVTMTMNAAKVLADPWAYTDHERLHTALTHLRAHAPVSWVEAPNYQPFWAITKHADIMAVERDNVLFTNSPRPFLAAQEVDPRLAAGARTLIHMDGRQHRVTRAIGAEWFSPRAMRALKVRVDELAKIYVDKMLDRGPECDFVQQVAVNYPLDVIMSLLGLPETASPCVLRFTRELFGANDSGSKRTTMTEGQLPGLTEAVQYFGAVIVSRREQPTEDLASAIANARIDGKPLSDIDALSYLGLFATAGHDTATATIAGGLHALIENPDQLARLRDNPGLMPLAIEEMIRWVTPTKQFMRTATKDIAVHGIPIAAGDSVLLSYASANRDEDVFDEPFRFDIGRQPNKHLAFGHGVHFCMGAALARMEVSSFFTQLLPRLKSIELSGDPEFFPTVFVGGLDHLPIRYSLS